MKYTFLKTKLVAVILLLTAGAIKAQVVKDLVIIEKFSGVHCGACPTAVHHIHDLIDNANAQVAVISYQTGYYSIPLYDNSDSQGRHSFYSAQISGYPTTIVGGTELPAFNVYQDYEDDYNNEFAETSPINIALTYIDNGSNNLTLNATLTEVVTAGPNLKLMLSITETNIDQDWLGENLLYDVNRKMLPTSNGTGISFSTSMPINVSESFTVDSNWDRDYLSAIAFVQNTITKEIIQATKISLADISLANDAMVDRVFYDTDKYCGATMSPKVRIRNSGNTLLQNVTIDYSIGGSSGTFAWSGSLGSFDQEDVLLPQITFTPAANVTFEASTTSPNGATDVDASNDLISQVFIRSEISGSTPSLEIKTESFAPWYTEWKLFDDQGNIVDQAGTSDWQEFTLYNYDFNLMDGCYEFVITDATGNGFVDYTTGPGQSNASEEDGYFILYDNNGNIIEQDENFGYELRVPFEVFQTTGIESVKLQSNVKVYPNPSAGIVNIDHFNKEPFKVVLTDVYGKIAFSSEASFVGSAQLNLKSLTSGYYLVKVVDSSTSTVLSLFID